MKRTVNDFAIFGGQPEFPQPLAVGRPNRLDSDRLLNRIQKILKSGQLTNDGPAVQEFEERVCEHLNVGNCVAVCNGTVALQIMAVAADLTGEVIVPSLTFIATAHALNWIGLTPVFADVDENTHTLCPESVAKCITPRTTAILGVHLWGNPCDTMSLKTLADRHNLRLLFDASHAFGCESNGVPIGNFGDAEAISFHATKVVQAIEGGAVVTNNDEIAAKCRLLRNFGITGFTQIESAGTNGKLNELCATAGLTSLESIETVVAHNRRNLETYEDVLDSIPGLQCATISSADRQNAHYVVVRTGQELGLSRDELLTTIRAEGIFARSYFVPGCHRAAPYVGNSIHTPVALPVTERLLSELMQLPTGLSVSATDIRKIGCVLQNARRHASGIRSALASQTNLRHSEDPDTSPFPVPNAA